MKFLQALNATQFEQKQAEKQGSLTELKRGLDLQTTQPISYFTFCEQRLGIWWVCKQVLHHPAHDDGHCRCPCLSLESSPWEMGALS